MYVEHAHLCIKIIVAWLFGYTDTDAHIGALVHCARQLGKFCNS